MGKSKKKKDSRDRSQQKHKSKKKKQSRSPSRSSRPKERKREYYQQKKPDSPQQATLSDKNLIEIYGSLPGFNLEFFRKLQDQIARGNKPIEDNSSSTLMGLSALGFLPYINQSIPIQLPNAGSQYKKSSRQMKNMKTTFKSRLLVPLSFDSFMVILEDQFYQQNIQEEILAQMKKRIIQHLKKRIAEQKVEEFNEKIDKLELQLKKTAQPDSENFTTLTPIQSVVALIDSKQLQSAVLDAEVKEAFQKEEIVIEKAFIKDQELFDSAKQLILSAEK